VTDISFTASFLKPVIKMGVVIITRLRKDSVLYAELKQLKNTKEADLVNTANKSGFRILSIILVVGSKSERFFMAKKKSR